MKEKEYMYFAETYINKAVPKRLLSIASIFVTDMNYKVVAAYHPKRFGETLISYVFQKGPGHHFYKRDIREMVNYRSQYWMMLRIHPRKVHAIIL